MEASRDIHERNHERNRDIHERNHERNIRKDLSGKGKFSHPQVGLNKRPAMDTRRNEFEQKLNKALVVVKKILDTSRTVVVRS
jgi:hypothetical protein